MNERKARKEWNKWNKLLVRLTSYILTLTDRLHFVIFLFQKV